MILLKGFLRKKKIKIYISIFSILFTVIFLLSNFNDYSQKNYNDLKYNSTEFIVLSKNNHEEIFEKDAGIKTYRVALGFEAGKDSDVIYTTPIRMTENGIEKNYDLIDDSKMEWELFENFGMIPAFSSASCNVALKDNEVALSLYSNSYKEEYRSEYIGKEMNFKFNNQEISLYLNTFLNESPFSYICISDNLYNNLLPESDKFLGDLKVNSYEDIENVPIRLKDLEDNDFFEIIKLNNDMEFASNEKIFEGMLTLLKIGYITSLFIFFLIAIFVIKDLISDDKKDIILFKVIGYNKYQNTINTMKNLLIFNLIIMVLSIVLTTVILLITNILFKLNIRIFNLEYYLIILIFIILIEFIFTLIEVNKAKN